MKKLMMMVVATVVASVAMADAASVTVGTPQQRWPWNGKVDVGYALSNTAAANYYRLITAVTVGGTTKTVTNELGAVSDGNYKTTVDCAALFGTGVLAPASVTMAVVAYSAPAVSSKWRLTGPFLILDLGGENGKGEFSSATYETAADLPTGAWNLATGWADAYKTRYLVMRKVKAGVPYPCEPNASSYPITKTMTPAKDYWIGVHQVTQEQYARVMGKSLPTSNQAKPANVSWNEIRTGSRNTTRSPTEAVAADSFMYKLCQQTGLAGFDLPTEAQWEIAARAGSAEEYGAYVDVNGYAVKVTADNLANIAWYEANNNPSGTKEVGQLRPNLWGLYDTAGNVREWCWDSDKGTAPNVETPAGDSSDYRVFRGGVFNADAAYCRPSNRFSNVAGGVGDFVGFRLSRICDPDAQDK